MSPPGASGVPEGCPVGVETGGSGPRTLEEHAPLEADEMTGAEGPTDGQVVFAVLGGHREMFRILVRRYQDVLFRHAERMVGSHDEACEIVQQALVTGYRKLRKCKDPERVGGWLFRIAANLCKDHLKSRRRRDVSLDEAPTIVALDGQPGAEAERMELRASIDAALGRLSPEMREAFVMKHMEGHSYDEMSEWLGVSVSALKMRVHRAREELQSLLRVHG